MIVSGSGYIDVSLPPFGEPVVNVVVDDTESSISEVLEGVGEVARSGEVLKFLNRIFCSILVSENGRACVDNGFEYSSTVVLMAEVTSSLEV